MQSDGPYVGSALKTGICVPENIGTTLSHCMISIKLTSVSMVQKRANCVYQWASSPIRPQIGVIVPKTLRKNPSHLLNGPTSWASVWSKKGSNAFDDGLYVESDLRNGISARKIYGGIYLTTSDGPTSRVSEWPKKGQKSVIDVHYVECDHNIGVSVSIAYAGIYRTILNEPTSRVSAWPKKGPNALLDGPYVKFDLKIGLSVP